MHNYSDWQHWPCLTWVTWAGSGAGKEEKWWRLSGGRIDNEEERRDRE